MPDAQTLGIYLTAALVLAITPGPGIFYVLTRSIKGGRQEGYASSLGTGVGGFFHVIAAALGLSAILATSALAFNLVKYLGAAYLIFLGVKTLLSQEELVNLADETVTVAPNHSHAFRQGIITEVLNPKTALFFLAFIPQFVNPEGVVLVQFILLGSLSVFMNTSADLVVATLAGSIASQLKQHAKLRQAQRYFTGGGLIALGAYVAVGGHGKQSS